MPICVAVPKETAPAEQRVALVPEVAKKLTSLGLDVSIQAQIIALLKRLCADHNTAVILITHDMGVIAQTCDKVVVMYAGKVAEKVFARKRPFFLLSAFGLPIMLIIGAVWGRNVLSSV